eukprot:m.29825 g.29825  ORF g.29825 m.29825 type:complete len:157 (+) comp11978_c0_seq4:19-489(+)
MAASCDVAYKSYTSESTLSELMALIEKDLSEPYSVYTYRYFIYNWPQLCQLAYVGDEMVGAVVCRLTRHKSGTYRGYIGMIAVKEEHRRKGIGSKLATLAVDKLQELKADEVVLETEITNKGAIKLYQSLGFVQDKYLNRYYLNGNDAIRLKLYLG